MALGTRPIYNVEQAQTYVWDTGTLSWIPAQQASGGGGGGGAVTIANGADVALGNTTDAAVSTDTTGTVSGKLRGIVKILSDVWDNVGGTLNVSVLSIPGAESTAIIDSANSLALLGLSATAVGIPNLNGALTVQGTDGMMPISVTGGRPLSYASGVASSSGNNTLITPAFPSNSVRVYYVSYNPVSPVDCGFRFNAGADLFLRNSVAVGGSIIAKDFGDFRYLQGGAGEPLMLNLSAAVSTVWNVFYVEVT